MDSTYNIGNHVKICGNITYHSKYGEQIKAIKVELLANADNDYFYKTILTEKNGIGKVNLGVLKKNIGPNLLDVLEDTPEKVKLVLTSKLYESLYSHFERFKNFWESYRSLFKYNIGYETLEKLNFDYDYGPIEILEIINNNPYLLLKNKLAINLIDDIVKIDDNIEKFAHYRTEALIYKDLLSIKKEDKGYCFPIEDCDIHGEFIIDPNDKNALNVFVKNDEVYILKYFEECEILIHDILSGIEHQDFIYRYDDHNNLTTEQLNFIKMATTNPVSILTGGPGTGKSTTIKYLVETLSQHYKKSDIILCALCGVAVYNIDNIVNGNRKVEKKCEFEYCEEPICAGTNEIRNRCLDHKLSYMEADTKSSTLHRIIFNGIKHKIQRREKVLIIDELSLVDISTFALTTKYMNSLEKIILVGDPNQLPSIGPGQLLIDLLKVESIPRIKLTRIQRQSEQSLIIDNAYKVLEGNKNLIYDNSQCLNKKNLDDSELINVYKNNNSVHVVTLTNKESNRINNLLQNKMNENMLFEYIVSYKKYKTNKITNAKTRLYTVTRCEVKKFKLNDKVKQIKNNYKKGVYNGEIGIIFEISAERLKVMYAGNKEIEYKIKELVELRLAYSTTIHSTQGSEYDIVFIIINDSKFLINRNIIYTALTRAKKKAIIIGSKEEIDYGISKKYVDRATKLSEKFK